MLAKVFQSGNSQAVRLPKEFRFDVDEVEIFRRGDELVLRPRALDLKQVLLSAPKLDLEVERDQDEPVRDLEL